MTIRTIVIDAGVIKGHPGEMPDKSMSAIWYRMRINSIKSEALPFEDQEGISDRLPVKWPTEIFPAPSNLEVEIVEGKYRIVNQ